MKIRIKRQELISDFPYIVQCENDSYYWVTVAMCISRPLAKETVKAIKARQSVLDATGYLFM